MLVYARLAATEGANSNTPQTRAYRDATCIIAVITGERTIPTCRNYC